MRTHILAHLVTTGLGPLYDGMGHLALSPEYWVPIFALSLFAGLQGAEMSRRTLLIVPVAWLIGGTVGQLGKWNPHFPMTALSFLITGLLVATNLPLASWRMSVLAAIVGGWQGGLNAAAAGGEDFLAVLGSALPIFVLVSLTTGLVVSLQKPWLRIAVRVLGSWVAATGLLLLGWFFRLKN